MPSHVAETRGASERESGTTSRLVIIAEQELLRARLRSRFAAAGLVLLRPARKGEPARRGKQFFKPPREIIESVKDTFKGQLELERHGGHTTPGVLARILQRILAMIAAIWHNDHASQPTCAR